jgi:hypothetical protein
MSDPKNPPKDPNDPSPFPTPPPPQPAEKPVKRTDWPKGTWVRDAADELHKNRPGGPRYPGYPPQDDL